MSGFTFNPDAAVFVPGGKWAEVPSAGDMPSANVVADDWDGGDSSDAPAAAEAAAGDTTEQTEPDQTDAAAEEVNGNKSQSDTPDEEVTPPPERRVRQLSAAEKKKEYVNVVFCGHVDAGKSTIGGQIMALTGMVDKRTLEKFEREAKEKNRETWYLSWALDTNIEERDKGKTVEVGRAYFETDRKHFTILDAPGHKSFVPNMISGASQADLAVLVISARKGEFETGFERGGQTREHAMLVKTAGVRHLVVLINKMDDPTVEWDQERYNECRDKLIPFLKKSGFNPKTDIFFIPCSGLTGAFLKDRPEGADGSWYDGPTFIDYIDALPSITRSREGPLRLPVVDKYSDMGTIILGKVESGYLQRGQNLLMMPNRVNVQVLTIWSDDDETDEASTGENVKVKLKGIEEADILPGFVLCNLDTPCTHGRIFDAQVVILEHKSIICPGYSCVLHIHAAVEEVVVKALIDTIDRKTGKRMNQRPRFVKQDTIALMRFESSELFCLDTFKAFPQMGRFTLRDEGKTIAVGKVLKVVE